MEECKVSIILPIYNSELYLEECIDSILAQTYSNFELIIVNDGSTDNSVEICNQYIKKDSRIILITQKNKGVSSARNLGIKIAKGEYVVFVDSDDFLMPMALSTIVKNFKSIDLVCFGFKSLYLDKEKDVICHNSNINNNDIFFNQMIFNHEIGGSLWNKAYRRKIIIDNNIRFDENIHFCEDLLFNTDYFTYCKNVKYIMKCLYNYRKRRSSITYNFYSKKNISRLVTFEKLSEKYKNDVMLNSFFKYNYISYYYKIKSIIPKNYVINQKILKQEKEIIKELNLSKKEKINFLLTKYANWLYRIIRNQRNKRLRLFK